VRSFVLILVLAVGWYNWHVLFQKGDFHNFPKDSNLEKIETFRTAIAGIRDIPDPLNIYSVYQWFILDSISENLVRFNHLGSTYDPVIAESWTTDGKLFRFKIRQGLKFHDGTPLTIEDIIASFQRIFRLKKSTHFQVWRYIKDIRKENNELVIELSGSSETLFMFLSSPEGAIWSQDDVLNTDFKPKRFSGFYFPTIMKERIDLSKNHFGLRNLNFPNAPTTVYVYPWNRDQSLNAIREGKLDAMIADYTPYSDLLTDSKNYAVTETIPIALVYLLGLRTNCPLSFNSSFLNAIRNQTEPSGLLSKASGLLPPGVPGELSTMAADLAIDKYFDSENKKTILIGYLESYHSEEFVNQIKSAAEKSGVNVLFESLTREMYYKTLLEPTKSKFDYILIGYLASDKFPLTQLKLLLADFNLDFDFDRPDFTSKELIELLHTIQIRAIERQLVIPLYFAPVLHIARKGVDLGDQPTTDGELQYWRVNERIRQTQ
jgi:hypothetical protein